MAPAIKIDISENTIRNRGRVLDILLLDKTSGSNIIWATDSYVAKYGKEYAPKKHMQRMQVTGANGKLIQPRAAKSKEEQKFRTKDKAEVFTPLKIVKEMNMAIDWASENWPVSKDNWIGYISERRLEITCGEAPFIAGRYNPTANTKKVIEVHNRVGFLDRKLQVVSEFTNDKKEWLHYAEVALKASYGYEWQGDNLLIARENIVKTVDDFYKDFCKNKLNLKTVRGLTDEQLEYFAEIVAWNIWQMDGLSCAIPMTRVMKKRRIIQDGVGMINAAMLGEEKTAYTETIRKPGKYAKIMDWSTGKSIKFVKLLRDDVASTKE